MPAKQAINPFRFGPLALDDAFTDRESEIASLVADARNGQDVVVFAPRRYGKSSLVWRVAQELIREDVLVAQVDLMRTPTKDQLAAKLARTIHEDLASRLWNAKERLKVFAGLRLTPTITINPNDGAVSFSFDARAAAEDIDATLEELLTMLGRIAADRDRRVVLVLDEFQEVVDIDPSLIKLMRSVFQEQPDVAHIYLGSKRHMMRRIFSDENEPFWRSAKQIELDVIAPTSSRRMRSRSSRRPARSSIRRPAKARWRSPAATPTPRRSCSISSGRREHSIAHWRRRSGPSTLTSVCSGTTPQAPRSGFSRLLPRKGRGARSAATTSAGIRCRPPRRCKRR